MMTNSELRKQGVFRKSHRSKAQKWFGHSMDNFFIGRQMVAARAEVGAGGFCVAGDEVIWAKADASLHGNDWFCWKSNHCASAKPGFVIALKTVR